MLTRAATAVVVLAVLTGCGGTTATTDPTTDPTTPDPAVSTSAAPATSDPTSAAAGAPGDQPRLADEPSYDEEFDDGADGWTGGSVDAGAYVLEPGAASAVPATAPDGSVGALVELGLVLGSGGAASLACDLGDSGAVAVQLDSDGSYAVTRTGGGGTEQLLAGTLVEGDRARPGELTALRLLCAQGTEGLAVGVSFHGGQVQFVEGVDGEIPSGGPTFTVTATGGEGIRVEQVLLTPVRP